MRKLLLLLFLFCFTQGFAQEVVIKGGRHQQWPALRWAGTSPEFFRQLWTDSVRIDRLESGHNAESIFLPPMKSRLDVLYNTTPEEVLFLTSIEKWVNGDSLPKSFLNLLLLNLDLDLKRACRLGMGWIDSASSHRSDLDYVITIGKLKKRVSVPDRAPLLKTITSDSALIFANEPAVIRWKHNPDYVAYELKRKDSLTGKELVLKENIIPLFTSLNSDSLFFPDTTLSEESLISYSIRGKDVFGNTGDWSLPIHVLWRKCSEAELLVQQVVQQNSNWVVEVQGTESVDENGEVYFSYNLTSEPFAIPVKKLNLKQWEISPPPDRSGYLLFCSGEGVCKRCSPPFRVIVKDTVAPEIVSPIRAQLNGQDSLVIIKWGRSKDTELKGYSVFRKFNRRDEWQQLNSSFIMDTVFSDSTVCRVNSDSVFYCVTATDKWYNHSEPSNVAACPLLFQVTLLPPVIRSVSAAREGNHLKFLVDTTLVGQWFLYRGEGKEKVVLLSGSIENALMEVRDTLAASQRNVYYQLACCYRGQCVYSEKYWTRAPSISEAKNPASVAAEKVVNKREVKVFWRYGLHGDVQRVHLYRITDGGQPEWLYTSSPLNREYSDGKIYPGHQYKYLLILEKRSGEQYVVKGEQEMIF